jgi:serine protease Do
MLSPEEMIAQSRRSVVVVQEGDDIGSGFFISPGGYILSCNHVVLHGDHFRVITGEGEVLEGKVYARDPQSDLAILHVPGFEGPQMRFGDPTKIWEGQVVYALGHPLGLDFTISKGVVSSRNRMINDINYLQTDVSLNPGNSGGPVVNEEGDVVGVADMVVGVGRGLGFAVSNSRIFAFASQLRLSLER